LNFISLNEKAINLVIFCYRNRTSKAFLISFYCHLAMLSVLTVEEEKISQLRKKTFQFKLDGIANSGFVLEDITFIYRDLGAR